MTEFDDLPHSCRQIIRAVRDDTLPVNYRAPTREYSITYLDGGSSVQLINFCPFCGSALPPSLRDEYFARREVLGVESEDDAPADMKSDRWWRDAGL